MGIETGLLVLGINSNGKLGIYIGTDTTFSETLLLIVIPHIPKTGLFLERIFIVTFESQTLFDLIFA
jgi:hypothetical protein